jgi:hypothetical protein
MAKTAGGNLILDPDRKERVETVVMGLYKAALQAATLGKSVDRTLVMTACEELVSQLEISVSSVVKAIREQSDRPVRSDQRQLGV